MYDGSYAPTPRENPSPSNARSPEMNATPNIPLVSASGAGPSRVQSTGDGTHMDFSQMCPQRLMPPLMQGAFQLQNQLFQGNPDGSYNGGPAHGANLSNAMATPSPCQGGGGGGGGGVPTIMPHGGLPMALPISPSGQGGNAGASFQAGQPWRDLYPDLFARPDAQGIPGPLWELMNAAVQFHGSDDLHVVIHFRRTRP